MKNLLILIFSFISFSLQATDYYIATIANGGDNSKTGLAGQPWATLSYACENAITSGDIIHVNAGTFIETTQSVLAVGVSIVGVGATSIIKSQIATTEYTSTILIQSTPQGTAGNQSISYIKMDGDALTASVGIEIINRSNVKIFNCQLVDFKYSGIKVGNGTILPTTFATGNEIYNCNITNCSGYYTNGRGAIQFGGQDGLKIYGNTLSQNTRGYQLDGYLIKYNGGGYSKGVKIYNNIIDKAPYDGTWCFAIELTKNLGGLEIYNNTISGAIDGDYDTKGDYDYCLYLHNNIIGKPVRSNLLEIGLDLENKISDVIVRYNHFYNLSEGIRISTGQYSDDVINNLYVQYNIFDNIGILSTSYQSKGIYFTSGDALGIIQNLFIDNNIFAAYAANSGGRVGILLPNDKNVSNLYIRNNVFENWDRAFLNANGTYGATTDHLYVQNNILYQNGQSNNPYWESSYTVTNLTSTNNVKSDPLFVSSSDFHLQSGSPAKDAGINIGLIKDFDNYAVPYNGIPDIGAYEFGSASFLLTKDVGRFVKHNGKLVKQ